MTPEMSVQLVTDCLMAAFWLAAPMLFIGFVVSTVINLLQILTSLQDSVISTVPRLVAFLVLFVLLMPWMVNRMTSYTHGLFRDLWKYVG